jgi:hypothetical protein
VLTLLAILGGYWLNKKQNFGWLEIAWLAGMIGFLTLGRARMFFWYIVPIYPTYLLFAMAAFPLLFERIKLLREHPAAGRAVVIVGLMVALAVGLYRPVRFFEHLQQTQLQAHRETGVYLSAVVKPDELVSAEDIGYMGFFSKRRIMDRDGLVSPEVIPYNERGDFLGAVMDFHPDWVVVLEDGPISGFVHDSTFQAAYVSDTIMRSSRLSYRIYRQRPKSAAEPEVSLDNAGE